MYTFAIPTGLVTLRACDQDVAICELWLDDGRVGRYGSAAAAAAAVSERRTGCAAIDRAESMLPPDIEAWHWISVNKLAGC